ncbi:xylulokinase [Actinomadura montaniterrae]|uniref:Xylulose kinase n=1 Tax=Actinomadura montaniterrae TaxID=1803903 RepID=A0A6L3VRB8_9ACTN|nr:xylulokinase [Actinomadura montaniterrae]KAB2369531.1 xylulokinase [Actinomadura montaniterrae]
MAGTLVAGVDSSTQSTKVVLCRAEDGAVVGQASAPHPDGTECHPRHWWDALAQVRDLLERADAVAVAAQQHGMVALDGAGEVVRPALLWNDTRSAPQARALVAEHGGPKAWAERTGSVPLASFTVGKLRWMAEHEPGNARRTERVMLPHDWLTWRLGASEPVTDRGDASGTGYWSPATGSYLPELLRAALGHDAEPPRVAAPGEAVGETSWGAAIGPGTGDNMGAALGLGLEPGDVVVSIGTSGTAFAVADSPAADPSGLVAGFADATGRFLPLVCTLNAARILTAAASMTGAGLDELSALALAAEPGAGGLTLLPYLDGERTPDRPGATGVLAGLTTSNATRENIARAAVEALLCSLADAVGHLAAQGVTPRRTLLIGGGARSDAVRALAPAILGTPVTVPEPAEYVALGAARQAAWALAGTPEPPRWPAPPATEHTTDRAADAERIRARYAALRDSAPQI